MEIKREEEMAAEKAKKGDKRNAVSAKKDNGTSKIPAPKKSKICVLNKNQFILDMLNSIRSLESRY